MPTLSGGERIFPPIETGWSCVCCAKRRGVVDMVRSKTIDGPAITERVGTRARRSDRIKDAMKEMGMIGV